MHATMVFTTMTARAVKVDIISFVRYHDSDCLAVSVLQSFLVMSDGTHVRGIDSNSSSNAVLDMFEPIESPKPVGVDFDAVQRMIYWTDISNGTIYRSSFEGDKQVLLSNLSRPEGIAVDWIGRKVYYTDDGRDEIGVVTMDGQQHVILLRNLTKPRAIVVDPETGYSVLLVIRWCNSSRYSALDTCTGLIGVQTPRLKWQTWLENGRQSICLRQWYNNQTDWL